MKKRKKILVVFDAGGSVAEGQDLGEELKSPEWRTEANVLKALKTLGYPFECLAVYDNPHLISKKLEEFKPNLIFNLVESFRGKLSHDRDIASFFKLLEIPFTGCGPTGLTLCKDKGLSKQILSFHRVHIPGFVMLPKGKPVRRPQKLRFPILMKPLSEEASYGISQASFVENDDQFRERAQFIHENLSQDAIAEEYIEGRELYVSVFGNKRTRVLPIRELKFAEVPEDEPKIATFKAKWDEKYRERWGIRNQFVGTLSNGLKEKIEKLSKRIYRLLSITGYARLDLRLKDNGNIYFIEANPNPILAEEEDFAESAHKAGISYPQLIDKIIALGSRHEED